jgi:5-methyltetrahydrofolate--homocysteine methyltransferase
VSGCATQLPTWALLETADGERLDDGDSVQDAARDAVDAGAHAVIFDVPNEAAGRMAIEIASRAGASRVGVLLAAGPDSKHGVPNTSAPLDAWVGACKRLVDAGARIVGGGASTTLMHLSGLSQALGGSDRSSSVRAPVWPQAV